MINIPQNYTLSDLHISIQCAMGWTNVHMYGFNRTSWRQVDILKVMSDEGMGIAKNGLREILKNSGYTYRKAKTVLTSNDPDYKEKLAEITKILSNLKQNEKFFSIDEYGPFAIKIQGGKSLVPAEKYKSVPQYQKSKGSLILTAALELSSNQVTHFYSEKKNTEEMIKLLNLLIKQYSREKTIYFSWDAASWHASKALYTAVDKINTSAYREKHKCPKVILAPLPTCAQFLNVIESVFSGMARAIIHNSNYQSVNECKAAIDRYYSERNEFFIKNPKRAGNKIWGKERVNAVFNESNNCKDPNYR
ncbi:MAG: transposase [Gammaproteobacteria bacterium]|nr:transposase [Gammaproteobacteria bacterium]